MKTHAVRLRPGADLRRELAALAHRERWPAACIVAAVGSLTEATIRFAGRHDLSMVAGPLEIVSLSGTLSADDGPHLHVAVADAKGTMVGGHLADGSRIRTTAEIVVLVLSEWRFARAIDPATGFRELCVEQAKRSG